MAKKSSKTAHVLNLLSPTIEEDMITEASDTKQEAGENISSADVTEPLDETSSKIDTMEEMLHPSNHGEELSLLIKDNLESEYEKSIAKASDVPTTQNIEVEQSLAEYETSTQTIEAEEAESISTEGLDAETEDVIPVPTPDTETEDAIPVYAPDTEIDAPKERESQDTELPQNIEEILASTNMVKSVENALAGDNILQQSPENTTSDTAKSDDAPIDIDALLTSTNMVKSIENALMENPTAYSVKSNTATEDTAITTEDIGTTENIENIAAETPENNISNEETEIEEVIENVIENTPFYSTNIFETIVKECVLEYMQRFEVCTCERCIADVTALALTNLPSKYIVTDYENVAALIHFLEHKHEVLLMTALTKACLTVHTEPRHQIKKRESETL